MVIDLFKNNNIIKNPVFKEYNEIYAKIYHRYLADVTSMGIGLTENSEAAVKRLRQEL
ncbi:MAG: hypothetical protein GX333_05405, partial [Syntrophomonadaceae bacterium]|nr:hypothetical protein [Syntrophomonadaceae bacterium]